MTRALEGDDMTATLPSTELVSVSDVTQLLAGEDDVRIFDVRTGGEFAAAHIPGSFNIPLSSLDEHVADLAALDGRVVLVCQSGSRARQAHRQIAEIRADQLHILDGGIEAWRAGGGEVVLGTSETWAMERQVRLTAGSISLFGILLSIFFPKAKWLAGGVASGLVFSAVTDTCGMANVLGRLPYNRGDDEADLEKTLAALRTS